MDETAALLYLDNQLCFPLYAASRLTTRLYEPLLQALDLTYPQYLVLLVLWEHGELSVKDLGQRLFLESNTLTPLLKRLEQKGLIERRRSPSDERSVLLSLTASGQALKAQALAVPQALLASLSEPGSFSEAEIRQFQQTLAKLLALLAQKT